MSATTNGHSGGKPRQPIVRTGEQAMEDHDQLVQRVKALTFTNWPNAAGFADLDEIRGPIELPVQGTIPVWTEGSLYRTGPGTRTVAGTPKGVFKVSHWFDGFAHSHKFDIVVGEDGNVRVMYSSRRQSEEMIDNIKKAGDKGFFSFGQKRDPCVGLFSKVMSVYQMATPRRHTAADNICVVVLGDVPGLPSAAPPKIEATSEHRVKIKNTWLTTDTNCLKEMDPETLEPIGFATQEKLHPDLKGPISCAHAQRDPETGDMFNFNLSMGRHSCYRVFKVSATTGETEILAAISLSSLPPTYNHSFFLSPSFVILCCTSAHIGWNGMKIVWEKNVVGSLEPFTQDKKMKWFIVDRHHGRGVVARYETDPGFFFHSVNSFEESVPYAKGGQKSSPLDLFCDMIHYDNLDVIDSLYYDVLTNQDGAAAKFWGVPTHHTKGHASLKRFRFRVSNSDTLSAQQIRSTRPMLTPSTNSLPVQRPEVMFTIPSPHIGEMPTINPAYHTKRHRYMYAMCNRGYSTLVDTISKIDLETKEVKFWNTEQAHTPGEAIFVPRPGLPDQERDEDDGVLLSIVLDGVNKFSYLVCLDAKTMTETGRAVCDFPVALGFHGMHTTGNC
ncbi:hypothetical protein MKZ38_010241 [Zalerion maritima]|uniref:Carotenoid oxygenase n=1 Tax=Zalerion maritima TaxID=339359 RepID=A0AAD5RSI2_9PEZI|nr:hypothetical protein MKZ38_010241 [Zalerion maritima]